MDIMSESVCFDKIKLIIIDVDGTMTDAGIYYDENGNEFKKFSTKDAAGFFAAHQVGIKIMVLTGRNCQATTRRMTEMKVDYLIQDCKDKITFLKEFMKSNQLSEEEMGYLGDDLNDLQGMKLCGFSACPNDACEEVKQQVNYISSVKGGYGAVRDIISYLLKSRGEWNNAIRQIYGYGV